MKENFEDIVKINRFKLEEECEKQPVLIYYYGDLYVKAKKELMEKNLLYEKRRAELELEFRMKPEKFFNQEDLQKFKITEAVVEAFLDKNQELVEIKNEIISLNEKVIDMENKVRALEHRKNELDNLVQLWLKAYYSQPSTGKNSELQNEIRNSLNKKRSEL